MEQGTAIYDLLKLLSAGKHLHGEMKDETDYRKQQ